MDGIRKIRFCGNLVIPLKHVSYCQNLKLTQHIKVEIDLDEMDLMKAESKAKVPLEKEKAIEDALRREYYIGLYRNI